MPKMEVLAFSILSSNLYLASRTLTTFPKTVGAIVHYDLCLLPNIVRGAYLDNMMPADFSPGKLYELHICHNPFSLCL